MIDTRRNKQKRKKNGSDNITELTKNILKILTTLKNNNPVKLENNLIKPNIVLKYGRKQKIHDTEADLLK